MELSIIIPCRNESKNIEKCIENLFNCDLDFTKTEIIVVDGESTDDTLVKLKNIQHNHPLIKIISNSKQITPVAFNLGIKQSKGIYFAIVGARHFPSNNYFKECIQSLKENPDTVCAGGLSICIPESTSDEPISLALTSKFGVGFNNFRSTKQSGYVDTVGTPIFKKWIFDKIGLFDENLIRNQDDEFSYRITSNGYKIFLNTMAEVKYISRSTYKNLSKQLFQYGYWKVFVNKKHKVFTNFRQIIPPVFTIYLAVLMFFIFIGTYYFLFFIPLISYFILAFFTAIRNSLNLKRILFEICSYFVLHISYGTGYILGIIHFYILSKNPSSFSKTLTR